MSSDIDATVIVTESTRHGIANRYTFVRRSGHWMSELRAGQRAQDDLRRQSRHAERVGESESAPVSGFAKRQLAPLGVIPYRELRPGATVHLATGLDIDGAALVVLLEAAHTYGRERIDVSDIKTVVSQLGSRISQLDNLTTEQRRHAETALYAEIVRRCTKVDHRQLD